MSDEMKVLCEMLILIEMTCVNLFNVSNVCAKRTSRVKYFVFVSVFSAIHTIAMMAAMHYLNNFALSTTIYVLSGIAWAFVLMNVLYESLVRILGVLCTTWGFTFLGFTIAVLTGRFFDEKWREGVILLALTLIYAFFSPWYVHFCKSIFIVSRAKGSKNVDFNLFKTSVFWFISVFFAYLALTLKSDVFAIVCLLSMGSLSFSSYRLIHNSLKNTRRLDKLNQIVYEDDLTHLPNRASFFSDTELLINENRGFEIVFLDLNKFKSINDHHGHLMGNVYLQGFANAMLEIVQGSGKVYRLSGDEFVCVLRKGQGKEILPELSNYNWAKHIKSVNFIGVSAGVASYPEDGTTLDILINKADEAMYRNKSHTKRARER